MDVSITPLVFIRYLSRNQPSRGVKFDFRGLVHESYPLPPYAVYTSMTGGGCHETLCYDLISTALEGCGSSCSVFSDTPIPVQGFLDLCSASISTLHIDGGGCVLYRTLDRISLFVEVIQLSIHD